MRIVIVGGGVAAWLAALALALSAWRGLYRWLGRNGEVAANPVAGVRAPKAAKPLPKALGVDDAALLLRMISGVASPRSPAARIKPPQVHRAPGIALSTGQAPVTYTLIALNVLIYLVARGNSMAERRQAQMKQAQESQRAYIQQVAATGTAGNSTTFGFVTSESSPAMREQALAAHVLPGLRDKEVAAAAALQRCGLGCGRCALRSRCGCGWCSSLGPRCGCGWQNSSRRFSSRWICVTW